MLIIWQDLKHAARIFGKNPGFAVVAVLVTAMGIGANTAIFSVVNAVLLRPLPYDHAERLVRLMSTNLERGTRDASHSFLNFVDYRAQSETCEAITAYNDTSETLLEGDLPQRIKGIRASVDFFRVLGVQPFRGRTFEAEDETPGGSPNLVISHGMWQRRFGSDQNIIGRQINLDGKPRTIVGVLPAGFQFVFVDEPLEFFQPLDPTGDQEKQRGAGFFHVLARLKPDRSLVQAEAELQTISARLAEQYPTQDAGWGVNLVGAHEELVGDLRLTLLVLLGAVGLVLLIACANVANLQLARATRRGREMAIRLALGASRWRMVRQLLTESTALSMIGGGVGLLLALWGIDLIWAFVPSDVPRIRETSLDPAVLGFTVGASLLTGILFGMLPALQASRADVSTALKEGGRTTTEGRAPQRVRSMLIVAEVIFSVVLLIGAGLLIKSFMRLRSTEPGFKPHNVVVASISLPGVRYPKDEQEARFYQQLVGRVAALPGVETAGAILPLPLTDSSISVEFTVEGQPAPAPGSEPIAGARIITPGYLRAMGIPLISGRDFDDRDTADSAKVLLINQTLAERFFPGENPLGKRLDIGLNRIHGEIVGVVGDVRHRSLDHEGGPEYYVTYQQVPVNFMSLVVRGSAAKSVDLAALAASLRTVVQDLDKQLPVYRIRPMTELVADSVARQRFSMTLIVAFAALALALAAVGIFSVMSFLVAQRTHEIGIRMALGAQPRTIVSMVMRYAVGLTLAGVVIGLGAAFALTRVMAGLLYQVSATDPAVFAGVPLVLIGVAFAACLIPARRATRVDPMVALRYE